MVDAFEAYFPEYYRGEQMAKRFRDTGEIVEDFGTEFLVRCPRCDSLAFVTREVPEAASGAGEPSGYPRVRFACTKCSLVQNLRPTGSIVKNIKRRFTGEPIQTAIKNGLLVRAEEGALIIGVPIDWYFHLPLWLQIPCCGETLWAYNKEHLDYIERLVQADLREARLYDRRGSSYRNKTLLSRLPRWMKSAKNREEVLKGIARLREMLPTPSH